MAEINGKTILLTGASGGFGQAFTRQLLAKNGRLILTDVNKAQLDNLVSTVENGRGQIVTTIVADLSSQKGVQTLHEQVCKVTDRVDFLINNAGLGLLGRHDEVPNEVWRRLVEVNLLTPMHLCALFMPQMIERRSGHIVNIGSLASWTADIGLSAYAASKFGLRGFSETIAAELKQHNVNVSAVYPFYSRTPILQSPRFGTLASANPLNDQTLQGVTNPEKVVANMIDGIERERLHIFPDRTAVLIYRLYRYTPPLFKLAKRQFDKIVHPR